MARNKRRSNTELAASRYAQASARTLADTPPLAPTRRNIPFDAIAEWTDLRSHLEQELLMWRGWRTSEIEHDALVAQYLLPRRSQWLTQGGDQQPVPNSMIRGLPINQAILDPTGTRAMRIASAGLMEGLMSASRPWFKIKPAIKNFNLDRAASLWFETVEERIYAIMAGSNFYDCGAQMMEDLVSYGTGPMLIYEDDDEIINCYNPCAGEYLLANSAKMRVQSFGRLFPYSVSQMVEAWGLDACPEDVQSLWQNKGGSLSYERIVAHVIEPNFEIERPGDPRPYGKVAGGFTYREVYWVYGSSDRRPLEVQGYHDEPFICPRFWLRPNYPYGDSLGKDNLPDIMQLQQETMRKAELLEKHVRPPLNVPVELKNQPSSILPGRQNYVADTAKGIRSVFEVDPAAMQHITKDIAEIQQRIQVGFYNDLFLMLIGDDKTDRTAYEIAERKQEKIQTLGPVIERFYNEAGSKAIQRIFKIMLRKQLVPPLPSSLRRVPIEIEFVSMLALAQRAVKTAGMERLKKMQGFMAGTNKKVLLLTDDEEFLREYADALGVSEKLMRPKDEVDKLWASELQAQKQAQQQAQQAHAATEVTPALADAAKTLSDTDVGGGINALQMAMGSGAGRSPNEAAVQ